MPGIVGCVLDNEEQVEPMDLQRLPVSLLHFENYSCKHVHQQVFFAGVVDLISNPLHVSQDATGNACVAIGEVYNGDSVFDIPLKGNLAEIMLSGYLEFGASFVERLEGKFTAALWDNASRTVIVISDRYGLYPVYYSLGSGVFVFSSEQKSIMQFLRQLTNLESLTIDELALLEYFTFGYPLENRTFLKEIHLLSAGTILIYNRVVAQ